MVLMYFCDRKVWNKFNVVEPLEIGYQVVWGRFDWYDVVL